ncbi:hypothetical protein EVAR_32961_1 [Eumeta japonica]|uniref:Uncharacterized protein n=1 Tax=Eumeta variegata TaxID=151549 RepID=A0A4C1X050_EUMVA|nr:hypothetical protein EVAR_32961_1 [Eumeta japonica]
MGPHEMNHTRMPLPPTSIGVVFPTRRRPGMRPHLHYPRTALSLQSTIVHSTLVGQSEANLCTSIDTYCSELFICLVACAWSVQGIRVTFGTNTGPIVPPPPTPSQPPAEPYRAPAPVWEDNSGDTPDPNANWRPQLFVPQPRYTQVLYSAASTEQPLSNVRRFVNSYLPQPSSNPGPVPAEPITNYLAPRNIVTELSSQSVPGRGLSYFVPAFVNRPQPTKEAQKKQDDAKLNQVDSNDVHGNNVDSSSDLQWKHEKEAGQRTARGEGTPNTYLYQWPAYVARRQQ